LRERCQYPDNDIDGWIFIMTSQPEAGPHKVFCIGANKTGTTSLAMFFRSINYKVGNQEEGELLLKEWSIRNFGPIIELAKTADFFQDIPFSCPYTYQALDMAFPAAKFILSVRDSSYLRSTLAVSRGAGSRCAPMAGGAGS